MAKITVPDIGDFDQVEVIEVLVQAGDEVAKEDSLITLESDKATMEIPSPVDGRITEINVKVGDQIAQGDVIAAYEASDQPEADQSSAKSEAKSSESKADTPVEFEPIHSEPSESPGSQESANRTAATDTQSHTDTASVTSKDSSQHLLIIGSGPGGYTAAFRAADLGMQVTLVEKYPSLGGVCLNVGCIPSKALLHNAEIINEVAEMADHGILFGQPEIDLPKLADWKQSVVDKLTGGLQGMAKQRKVKLIQGTARFNNANSVTVTLADGDSQTVQFDKAIIAAGSEPIELPHFPHDDPRVMNSTDALKLEEVPERLLIVGGGIIGLEMAMVYDALGSQVDVVELGDGLMPGCDRDLVRAFEKVIKPRYNNIWLKTEVTEMQAEQDAVHVTFKGNHEATEHYDRVLVSIGRKPNGHKLNLEAAGVNVDDKGYIPVDQQQRTNINHLFAIGDIVGQPMLAHKATHEGKVAAEVCAGHKAYFDAKAIPAVAYTDPEVAWMGVTETEAKQNNIPYEKASFPWAASGRALSIGRGEGLTKCLFDPDTHRLIGAGIVGPNAGELIGETILALEMGADAQDMALTIHPHPTLSETVNFAAEVQAGTITDLYIPRRK